MAQTQLFWIFLEDCYSVEALKKLNLEGFDWSSCHETGQTLLVRCIHKAMTQLRDKSGNTLETIEWLIRSGASMEQKCTGGESKFGLTEKPEQPCIGVECRGHNAISYVWAVQRGMRQNLEHWNNAASFLTKILETFAEASVQKSPARPRVSIDAGIAELWEKSLAAKESHDLTIETADGLVTAHAHMLKAASSVVAAMLESPMKEGQAQRIEIKDASSKAVSLFLEILYTCSVQEELDHQTALCALDLAHRWQVDVVVAILTDLLAGMMTDESFASIGEHAVLKGLERLKAAAQRFGAESKKVQADLKAGRLPAAAAQLFPASKPSKSKEPKPKRRRV